MKNFSKVLKDVDEIKITIDHKFNNIEKKINALVSKNINNNKILELLTDIDQRIKKIESKNDKLDEKTEIKERKIGVGQSITTTK